MKKIKVIKYAVGANPVVIEIRPTLKAMQAIVGGYIEMIEFDGVDLYCNEEGRLLDLPPNRAMGGRRIRGDFFLARHDDEGETISVTDDDIARLLPTA